jgi:hypothetical protein
MLKLFQFSALAVCFLSLLGCPYESTVPISQPSVPVDSRYLGNWTSEDEVYNTYVVTKASATEYNILQESIGHRASFKGFLSEVKGNTFMNLYSDSTKSYYIYKVKTDSAGARLLFTPVADNLPEHFSSQEALKGYVEKNMNFKTFYDEANKSEYYKTDGGAKNYN